MHKVFLAAVAASITGANAWGDASLPMDVRGNNYRAAVKGITYDGLDKSGTYQRVTFMDPATGECRQEDHAFNSVLGPFADEISAHIRGPANLKRFAAYSATPPKKHKRDDAAVAANKHLKRHRRHAHGKQHQNLEKRGCGDWVTATWPDNGALYSFQYDGPGCEGAAPTPAPAPVAKANNAAPAPAPAAASPSAAPASAASSGFISGVWGRVGFYDAAAQKKEGITFLNNKGDPTLSGGWTSAMGNSLSYASADGCKAAKDDTVLADTVIPSVEEISIWTDQKCGANGGDPSGCGYYRPDTVAHHGFGGVQKAFVFEFTMPHGPNNGGPADDMGALWFLNAQNPRTSQYGPKQCKCWEACGEVDVFEILAPGENRVKTAIHGQSGFQGGNVDFFTRPVDTPMILAVVFMDGKAHIQQLDSFDFGPNSGPAMINQVTSVSTASANDISVANVY